MSIYKKLPQYQSDDEWWDHYDSKDALHNVTPLSSSNTRYDKDAYLLRYVGHRTTRTGSVALEFETLDGRLVAVKFFNVYLSSRGNKAYPAGHKGQFNPPARGKFRKFYKLVTGSEPDRWCRVHRSLKSKFRHLIFEGEIESRLDSNEDPYLKIIKLRLVE